VANTALPQPPKTNQKVPIISAASRWNMVGAVMCRRLRRWFGVPWLERGTKGDLLV